MAKQQSDLRKELELLREQVRELTESQKPHAEPQPKKRGGRPKRARKEASHLARKVRTQAEELAEHLRRDIDEASTTTCLTIFALGLLMGRTLSR